MTYREKLLQKSRKHLLISYHNSKLLPTDERYCLSSQIRRAALSVVLNITEGYSKYSLGQSKLELRKYLLSSYGSCEECKEINFLMVELGYLHNSNIREAISLNIEISKMLNGIITKL